MTFDKFSQRTPTDVDTVEIFLSRRKVISAAEDGTPVTSVVYSTTFRVGIGDDTSEIDTVGGNLVPHLTLAQINQLKAFIDSMYDKAVAEIL